MNYYNICKSSYHDNVFFLNYKIFNEDNIINVYKKFITTSLNEISFTNKKVILFLENMLPNPVIQKFSKMRYFNKRSPIYYCGDDDDWISNIAVPALNREEEIMNIFENMMENCSVLVVPKTNFLSFNDVHPILIQDSYFKNNVIFLVSKVFYNTKPENSVVTPPTVVSYHIPVKIPSVIVPEIEEKKEVPRKIYMTRSYTKKLNQS